MRKGFVAVLTAVAAFVALAACSVILGNKRPVASFSAIPSSGTSPLDVSFDASASYDPDGTVAGYHWDFGDGQSMSNTVAPHHQYTVQSAAKTFKAVLTVIDDQGSTDSAKEKIRVSP